MKNHVQKRMAMRGQGGFTLIELLVVIAILGILAAVVVFAVGNTTSKAQSKACLIEQRTLKTAVEAYKADNNISALTTTALWKAALTAPGTGYLDASTANTSFTNWDVDSAGVVTANSGGKCA